MCIGLGGYYVGFLPTSRCLKRYGKYIRPGAKVKTIRTARGKTTTTYKVEP